MPNLHSLIGRSFTVVLPSGPTYPFYVSGIEHGAAIVLDHDGMMTRLALDILQDGIANGLIAQCAKESA